MKIINLTLFVATFILIIGCDKSSDKQTILIEKGKVGLIGFGSLMSLKKTEEVFKHKYTDSIYLVHLQGFQRSWDFVSSNADKGYTTEELKNDGYYVRGKDTLIFDNSIFLNITEQKGSEMNGVMYMVTEKEIKDMDLYEFGYERIDVTDKIKNMILREEKSTHTKPHLNTCLMPKKQKGLPLFTKIIWIWSQRLVIA